MDKYVLEQLLLKTAKEMKGQLERDMDRLEQYIKIAWVNSTSAYTLQEKIEWKKLHKNANESLRQMRLNLFNNQDKIDKYFASLLELLEVSQQTNIDGIDPLGVEELILKYKKLNIEQKTKFINYIIASIYYNEGT